MNALAIPAGLLAGVLMGAVLQRAGLCFHQMFTGAARGRTTLLRTWLLGVGVAAVGLSVLYAVGRDGLNQGLPFRPVGNIAGGLIIGVGMAVARSCTSGLFYKLGAGMLGGVVGLAGWVAGELVARQVRVPGPTVLAGGTAGTVTGVLGVPRIAGALALLAVALLVGMRLERGDRAWRRTGVVLGVVIVAGWVLADAGGASFGPSTVGASASVAAGHPRWWLIGFLAGLTVGAHLAARASGEWRPRGESRPRYAGLAAGGFLLGAGGWIAGGCNIGHGLSGAAQLNVSSWVVVAAMAGGAVLARAVIDRTAPFGKVEACAG